MSTRRTAQQGEDLAVFHGADLMTPQCFRTVPAWNLRRGDIIDLGDRSVTITRIRSTSSQVALSGHDETGQTAAITCADMTGFVVRRAL